MQTAARENFNINDKIPNLKINVKEAIRLGKTQCTEIARFCSADMQTVFNLLRRMVSDGEIVTRRNGALTLYELAPRSKSPAGNPDFIKLNILKAIKADYRTVPWIKKHAGIEGATDITGIIDEMIEDGIIFRDSNPELTAFFLAGERPKNFYQKQDGTVHVDFEEENIMQNSSVKTAKEDLTKNSDQTGSKPRHAGRRARIDINEASLKSCAERGLPMEAAAAELGIGFSTIQKKLKDNPGLRRIWDEGHKTFKQTKQKKEVQSAPIAEVFIPKKCAECETEFVIENFVTEGENDFCDESCKNAFAKNSPAEKPALKEFDEIIDGHPGSEFPKLKTPVKPSADDALAYGDDKVKTDERFAHTVEHIEKNGHSGESIERVKSSVAAQSGVEVIPPPNRDGFNHFAAVFESKEKVPDVHSLGKIEFSDGDALICGFNGNFFKLSKKERGILNQMADLIQDYNEKGN